MPDEPSLGELLRRLDRIEGLLRGLVSHDVYSRDMREMERRFTELERDLDKERDERQREVTAIRAERKDTGANWRQAIYNGLIPAFLCLLTIVVAVSRASGK